jgi:hypothetical protein
MSDVLAKPRVPMRERVFKQQN